MPVTEAPSASAPQIRFTPAERRWSLEGWQPVAGWYWALEFNTENNDGCEQCDVAEPGRSAATDPSFTITPEPDGVLLEAYILCPGGAAWTGPELVEIGSFPTLSAALLYICSLDARQLAEVDALVALGEE